MSRSGCLAQLSPSQVDAQELAGDPIRAILTHAPGNGAPIGGLKVITDNGWFAVRPSGTEEVYKLYAESFRDRPHLERIQTEAQALVTRLFAPASVAPRDPERGGDVPRGARGRRSARQRVGFHATIHGERTLNMSRYVCLISVLAIAACGSDSTPTGPTGPAVSFFVTSATSATGDLGRPRRR